MQNIYKAQSTTTVLSSTEQHSDQYSLLQMYFSNILEDIF